MEIRQNELYAENSTLVDKLLHDMAKHPILHVGKCVYRNFAKGFIQKKTHADEFQCITSWDIIYVHRADVNTFMFSKVKISKDLPRVPLHIHRHTYSYIDRHVIVRIFANALWRLQQHTVCVSCVCVRKFVGNFTIIQYVKSFFILLGARKPILHLTNTHAHAENAIKCEISKIYLAKNFEARAPTKTTMTTNKYFTVSTLLLHIIL